MFLTEILLNPPESGRIGPPLCVNNSSPLGLANCNLIIPNTPTTIESTPPDQTKPITNSKTVSPQSKGSDVPILIAVIVVVVIVFISVTSFGVIVVLMIYRRSRTTQNTNEAATHTSTVTIDLAQNAAYGVTMETQRKKEAPSVVMSENAAYGVTTETQRNREASSVAMSENAVWSNHGDSEEQGDCNE